jgi:hypothetical protein
LSGSTGRPKDRRIVLADGKDQGERNFGHPCRETLAELNKMLMPTLSLIGKAAEYVLKLLPLFNYEN